MNPSGITLGGSRVPVEVEVEITGGFFAISIVGLPDASVRESKERVRLPSAPSAFPSWEGSR
ncbi:hypothetical protein MASR2M79_16340 [Aminivibrio sp.]